MAPKWTLTYSYQGISIKHEVSRHLAAAYITLYHPKLHKFKIQNHGKVSKKKSIKSELAVHFSGFQKLNLLFKKKSKQNFS